MMTPYRRDASEFMPPPTTERASDPPNHRRLRRRALGLALATPVAALGQPASAPPRPVALAPRILHVMSFESPWRWTDGQFDGFRETLALPQAQWKVFEMDTKRHRTDEAKAERGRLALELIGQWKPDLVYLSDDDAVAHVARPLAGQPLPIVFSGVNRDLDLHGLRGAPNITGVLEREHVSMTLRLLQGIVPEAHRLAVISDHGSYWDTVIGRVRERANRVPGFTLASVDRVATFAEFQRTVLGYARSADAVLYLGVLTLTAAQGGTVPYPEVARWVTEHSRLPDASFWIDRVHHGTLVSMTVSELEQGRAAGRLARAILVDGQTPSSLPVEATTKGHPAISLARARQLGLSVRARLLLSSEVVRQFAWDNKGV
ncbi:ABC transporter substrate-binding protein [Ideonella sp. A 288]|uniref:ABC transporter substrate-binding protein n=1 Tax=Ideonella sp. A 288 TaxID=1962181 RepID=UPI0018FEED31|nr:ABC transporter substrate binding protein [Ideonella sp. A 288]